MRAYRISERAARTGFDWDNIEGVMQKAEEEWAEFQCALDKKDKADISVEFGDILFTLVNVARFAAIHPETALKDSIKKFESVSGIWKKPWQRAEAALIPCPGMNLICCGRKLKKE